MIVVFNSHSEAKLNKNSTISSSAVVIVVLFEWPSPNHSPKKYGSTFGSVFLGKSTPTENP